MFVISNLQVTCANIYDYQQHEFSYLPFAICSLLFDLFFPPTRNSILRLTLSDQTI
jgi:hypothetical protein